ncbi:CRISPR-associated protein Cas4 [Rhodothermus bifroesti]|uniref:CRISPR-associated protein Cas4 n=2 Tax=Rhodothermus bifroesti TaxID=2823335 RepID=UPI0039ED445A
MLSTEMHKLCVTGTLVNYYVLCRRRVWLAVHGLWMEHESELVALGRLLDETSYTDELRHVNVEAEGPEGLRLAGRIDWAELRDGVLHETKHSPRALEAHRWQLRFYLWLLKLLGVTRTDGQPFRGQLNFPRQRRTENIILEPEHETRLNEIVQAIYQTATQALPPPRLVNRRFCKKCAYEELCFG